MVVVERVQEGDSDVESFIALYIYVIDIASGAQLE